MTGLKKYYLFEKCTLNYSFEKNNIFKFLKNNILNYLFEKNYILNSLKNNIFNFLKIIFSIF